MNNKMHVLLFDVNNIYMKNLKGIQGNEKDLDITKAAMKAKDFTQSKIFNISKKLQPTHICAAFDADGLYWRNNILSDYKFDNKTNKQKVRDKEIIESLFLCQEMLEKKGIKTVKKDLCEADDIIATITNIVRGRDDIELTIVSADKDLSQLYYKNVKGIDPFDLNKGYLTEKTVKEKFDGLSREKIAEYLALVGDQSDNIKGIPNIGKKSAIKLLKEYNNLEYLLLCADNVSGKKGESLKENSKELKKYMQIIDLKDININLGFKMSEMKTPNFLKPSIKNNYSM